ncbi:MAG: LysR substrate-binding domain-containing protein [Bacteroidales bacterium]|nr:MAG: LysR substrate-binding domain-containing protein [Bacteroidales bacterium]
MNIQQLRYIVAIDRFRNFARAADACNISQPTLSAMLVKLEDELDVRIFDRTNKVVKPTSVGERIIRQAQKALMETNRINELITESKGTVGGQLTLSIGPTIAPYLLPKFIKHYRQYYPSVELTVKEMKADHMLEAILNGEIDAGIAISDNARQGVLEMPLYTERFYIYLAESCWRKLPVFKPENLEHENMWIMKEAQCLRDSAFSFCKARGKGHHIYEAGSIETLIRIVDENGATPSSPRCTCRFSQRSRRKTCAKSRATIFHKGGYPYTSKTTTSANGCSTPWLTRSKVSCR